MMSMDDLIAFLNARLGEREEIAQSALVRDGRDWSLLADDEQGWWREGRDPVLLVGGKPLATFNEEYGGALVAYHVLATQPKHELADIAAKRRIVEEHRVDEYHTYPDGPVSRRCSMCAVGDPYEGYFAVDFPCETIKLLALPFASHPEYREEWRP